MGIALRASDSLGLGLYSYADVARFIGGKPSELRRWVKGYESRRHGSVQEHPPLWSSQWAGTDIDGIGFRDPLELRFILTFVACGVPLNLIRRTIAELRERLGKDYPFTSTSF